MLRRLPKQGHPRKTATRQAKPLGILVYPTSVSHIVLFGATTIVGGAVWGWKGALIGAAVSAAVPFIPPYPED